MGWGYSVLVLLVGAVVWNTAAFALANDTSPTTQPAASMKEQLESMRLVGRWEDILQATGGVGRNIQMPSSGSTGIMYRVEALMALERQGEALVLADRGVALDSDDVDVLRLRGDVQLAMGHFERAAEDYLSALGKDENMWQAVHGMALTARSVGEISASLEWYDRLVELRQDDAALRMERALVAHESGLPIRALRDMDVVLELTPISADAWNNRGIMHLSQDDDARAMADFDQALTLTPDHAEALLNRGLLWRSRLELARSLADLDAGVAKYPHHIRMRVARMYTHKALGNYSKALADLEAAYAMNNLDVYMLNEFAWFLATAPETAVRDGERAVRYAREALELTPVPMAALFDTLGAAYAEIGAFQSAVRAQEQALLMGMDRKYPEAILAPWRERLAGYHLCQPYRSE